MTAWARWTLAIVFFLSACAFVALAPLLSALSPDGAWPFYGLAAFCLLITVACLFKSSRGVALRIIGAVIFCAYVFYVYDRVTQPPVLEALKELLRSEPSLFQWGLHAFFVYSRLSESNVWRALLGFLVIGLPSGYLMIAGTYPRSDILGLAFHLDGDRSASEPSSSETIGGARTLTGGERK